MGHYYHNGNGDLRLISGRGRAEYGASTVRKTPVTIPQLNKGTYQVVTVTFETPMPDTDYLISLEPDGASLLTFDFFDKTTTGFRVMVSNNSNEDTFGAFTLNTVAFKLYTDTEYNEVLDKVNEANIATVTGNGVKTTGQLMNELYAKIDGSKLTYNSKLITPTGYVYKLNYKSADTYEYSLTRVSSTATGTFTITLKSSNSKALNANIAPGGTTLGDTTSTVIANGSTYTLKY